MNNPKTAPGWAILGLLTIAMLTVNILLPKFANIGPRSLSTWLIYLMAGFVAAEFGIVALWVALSGDSLVRRVLFLLAAWTMFFSAMMVGILSSLPSSQIVGPELEQAFRTFAGCSPILILASLVPVLIIRLTGRTLDRPPLKQNRGSYSIAGIMSLTGFVAIAFIGVDVLMASGLGEQEDRRWEIAGTVAGMLFGFSLLLVTPVFALLMRARFGWGIIWAVSYAMIAGVSGMVAFTAIETGGQRFFPQSFSDPDPSFSIFIYTVSYTLAIVLFTIGLRWAGFRFHKANMKSSTGR